MAAIAGAITSLAWRDYKHMSAIEIVMTIFVGFSFAIFVVPLMLSSALHISEMDIRKVAGITYIAASGANMLLPLMWRWLARLTGAVEEKS